jgi:ribosomal protein S18 acetylase RimI-like enzyme
VRRQASRRGRAFRLGGRRHALEGIGAIGLNVRADNPAAIRVYESLGFVRHCPFIEALATHPDR